MTIQMDCRAFIQESFYFPVGFNSWPGLVFNYYPLVSGSPGIMKKGHGGIKARFSIYIERKLAPNKDKVNLQLNLIKK